MEGLVAKSYQGLKQICEPYQGEKNRWYVKVRTNSGEEKEVRFYTEAEYRKIYKDVPAGPLRIPGDQKTALGFGKLGFIWIFKGYNNAKHYDFFSASPARYARTWGWYEVSSENIPDWFYDIPEGVQPIRLYWNDVGQENGQLKPEQEVTNFCDTLLYDAQPSEFHGEVGERLELTLTVTNAIELEGKYGHSIMHVMENENGDVFLWTTSSKHWNPETVHHLRGTVKAHNVYRGTKQTVLTRCTECKEK